VLTSLLSLTVTAGIADAAEQQTRSTPKKLAKTKPTQPPQTSRSRAKTAGPGVPIISEDVALATFDAFTIEWMKRLEQTEEFHKAQAQITPASDGFAVEYVGYLPHRYIHVKKTESADTPYVGVLTYFEKKLRCTAKTKEAALQGPFEQIETNQVSEIFRFTKGKWVY
jgi:hypothetical protein